MYYNSAICQIYDFPYIRLCDGDSFVRFVKRIHLNDKNYLLLLNITISRTSRAIVPHTATTDDIYKVVLCIEKLYAKAAIAAVTSKMSIMILNFDFM